MLEAYESITSRVYEIVIFILICSNLHLYQVLKFSRCLNLLSSYK